MSEEPKNDSFQELLTEAKTGTGAFADREPLPEQLAGLIEPIAATGATMLPDHFPLNTLTTPEADALRDHLQYIHSDPRRPKQNKNFDRLDTTLFRAKEGKIGAYAQPPEPLPAHLQEIVDRVEDKGALTLAYPAIAQLSKDDAERLKEELDRRVSVKKALHQDDKKCSNLQWTFFALAAGQRAKVGPYEDAADPIAIQNPELEAIVTEIGTRRDVDQSPIQKELFPKDISHLTPEDADILYNSLQRRDNEEVALKGSGRSYAYSNRVYVLSQAKQHKVGPYKETEAQKLPEKLEALVVEAQGGKSLAKGSPDVDGLTAEELDTLKNALNAKRTEAQLAGNEDAATILLKAWHQIYTIQHQNDPPLPSTALPEMTLDEVKAHMATPLFALKMRVYAETHHGFQEMLDARAAEQAKKTPEMALQ